MRTATLGLLLLALGGVAAAAAPPREEAELRAALRQTWIHGMSEAEAHAVAGEADVPALLRLLRDESFERPDNVAAVLAQLAGEEALPELLALARREPGASPSPERDRARLLLPRILSGLAERSGAPAARSALEELAESGDPDWPSLARAEIARISAPGSARPAQPGLSAPPRVEAVDAAPRVHAVPLSFANHVDHDQPMSAERLDLALHLASLRAGRADFDADVSCCIELERSGAAGSFGVPGDGLDVIDDAADLAAVRAISSARVKVVRLIRHCFGDEAPNIVGCAEVSGDTMIVVRLGSATVEGLVWLHEFGHDAGIAAHDPDDRYVMSAVTGFQDVALSAGQCAKLHAPEVATAVTLLDRGACADLDLDGVQDHVDNCPGLANFDQLDSDGDGAGEPCDPDDDGDGVPDGEDRCPGLPDGEDLDGDGVPSCEDGCPNDPWKVAPGVCGCGIVDLDADGDGTLNCDDGCPFDPSKTASGACGCGVADTDGDDDGSPDCQDGCPEDPAKTAPGDCGCGFGEQDADHDGAPDCEDGCPEDPAKTAPGDCGCGTPEGDADADGLADCEDACPLDPGKFAPGACGCGRPELDGDGDGLADCLVCAPGEAWPQEPDGLVDLRDYVVARRLAGLAGQPAAASTPPCLDLAPASPGCRPERLCPQGGDGLGAADLQVLRGLSSGLISVDCSLCAPGEPAGPSLRRPGDVAPPAAEGAGPEGLGDGRVDVSDVLSLLRQAVGLRPPAGPEERLRGDVAPRIDLGGGLVVVGDGFLEVADVLLLLRAAVGLDVLRWPLREQVLELSEAAGSVAVQVRLEGWPAWAEPSSASGAPCDGDAAGGLDAAGDVLVLTCAGDPEPLGAGPIRLLLRSRAPEPLPVEGAGAPFVSVVAVDPGLALLAAAGRLLPAG